MSDSADSLTIKERIKEGFWKAFVDEPIKKGVWFMIYALFTTLLGLAAFLWFSSSWLAAFAFGASLTLFLVAIYFVQLIVRNYFYSNTENAEINGTIDLSKLLQETKEEKAIKALEAKYKETFKKLEERHLEDIQQREESIREVSFLVERVRKERESINDYVKLERCQIHHIEDDSIPKIFFSLMIRNNSLFGVTLEDKIDGHILFRGETLQEAKRFHGSPKEISSASFGWLFIEYRLSKSEFDLIKDRKIGKNDFNITNLVLIIKGTKENQKVEPKQMKIDPLHVEGWDSRGEAKEDVETKPQPNIVCADIYTFDCQFRNYKIEKFSSRSQSVPAGEALVAKFYSEPQSRVQNITTKAVITVEGLNKKSGRKSFIVEGVWLKDTNPHQLFETGSFLELVLGIYRYEKFYLCERENLGNSFGEGLREVSGVSKLVIEVELIGTLGKDIYKEKFRFRVDLKPKFLFSQLNEAHSKI
ncbi:MAG TPA: hypothetical protein VK892_16535 [Pyrinomonadaceae bacterium]|nr:hypothetical protein [Pyrinomonadaceae bacterium]